jgi:23S rRNA (cytidine1920-2'-O)/16S rRNA (cytidine1409-2'-O)-methyltransferase
VAWLGSIGWSVLGVTTSPITGPEGNVEFLVAAMKQVEGTGGETDG